jgi:ADP-ribosylglycohydrolase
MTKARFIGALLGLAYGDAISFPALFHRFTGQAAQRRRHFVWRVNKEQDDLGVARLTLPFTHRDPSTMLEPCPTDDTEYALLTLRALLNAQGEITPQTFESIWRDEVLPNADQVRGSVSVRAAIHNFQRGLTPPITGNDNPLHFEDSAVCRAVPIGLYCMGQPHRAAGYAQWDAQITQAEDGIYAARGMAALIALLANGEALSEAVARAREEFPAGSWIAHVDAKAQELRDKSATPIDLALRLSKSIINTVYSYGNAAPETFPAALVLVEACQGDCVSSVHLANTIPKCADSLPAMVGAVCGAYQGDEPVSVDWCESLAVCHGVCLPTMKDVNVIDMAKALYEMVQVA